MKGGSAADNLFHSVSNLIPHSIAAGSALSGNEIKKSRAKKWKKIN